MGIVMPKLLFAPLAGLLAAGALNELSELQTGDQITITMRVITVIQNTDLADHAFYEIGLAPAGEMLFANEQPIGIESEIVVLGSLKFVGD